jgi:hypothetical protein
MIYEIRLKGGVKKLIDSPDGFSLGRFIARYRLTDVLESRCVVQTETDQVSVMLDENSDVVFGKGGTNNAFIDWWTKESRIAVSPPSNHYHGEVSNNDYWVCLNDHPMDAQPSLAIANHSPDGFSFGYCGSGPAQLALAMLLEETGNPIIAQKHYHRFMNEVVAKFPSKWDYTSQQIHNFLEGNNV